MSQLITNGNWKNAIFMTLCMRKLYFRKQWRLIDLIFKNVCYLESNKYKLRKLNL